MSLLGVIMVFGVFPPEEVGGLGELWRFWGGDCEFLGGEVEFLSGSDNLRGSGGGEMMIFGVSPPPRGGSCRSRITWGSRGCFWGGCAGFSGGDDDFWGF